MLGKWLVSRPCAVGCVLTMLASPAWGQMFQKSYGTPREERAEWVQQTTDGGYITVGWRGVDTSAPRVYAIKTDSSGVLQWDTELAGAGIDVATSVLEVADGYVIAGETTSSGAAGLGISLLKLDLTGAQVWGWAYPGTPFAGGSHNQTPLERSGLGDGGFILAGRAQGVQGINQAPILIRVDAGGNLIWARYYVDFRFDTATFASFADVHPYVSFNGEPGFLACGYTTGNTRDSLLVATDVDGVVRWARIYPQVDHTDFALGLDVAADGQILVSGFTKQIGEGGGTYVLRADQLGALIWYRTYRFFSSTNSMLETPLGEIVLAGNGNDFVSIDDPAILLLDGGGNPLWTMTYGGANQELGECVTPTSDGGYKLAAWTNSFGQGMFDIYGIKTDSAGMSGCNEQPIQVSVGQDFPELDVPVRDFNIDAFEVLDLAPVDPNTIEEDLCRSGCVDPPPDLVAWWPLDELDPAAGVEELVAGNDGVPFNGPATLPGEYVDNARCFDGIDDYIEVPDDPALNFGTGDFSIDAWIRTTSTSSVRIIVDKRTSDASGTTGYSLFTSAGNIAFQLADGAGSNLCAACPTGASCTNYISSDFVADGNWHLVAVTIDRAAGVGTFYVDGAPVSTFDISCHPNSVTNTSVLRIGSRSFSATGIFLGCIDEVELFGRALTDTEIAAIFAAGVEGKCKRRCVEPPPGMVSWWALDELDPAAGVEELVAGNDGVAFNGPTPLAGEYVDNARCFDGIDDYIEVADDPALNFGTGDFSIDAWIRTTSTSSVRIIVDKRTSDASGTTGYSLFTSAGNIAFQLADGAGSNLCAACPTGASCTNYTSSSFVADGNWHLVAVTIDRAAGVGTFYVDGAPVSTFDISCHPNSVTNTGVLRIGSRSFSVTGIFLGCIDEVELFGRALTDTEIADIFAAGVEGKCKRRCVEPPPGMVSWWALDETVATDPIADLIIPTSTPGVAVNGPAILSGEYVLNARCFDGIDDYIEVPDDTTLNFGGFDWAGDAWIRTTSTGTQRIVDKRFQDVSGTLGYSLYTSGGNLMFQLADGAGSNVCAACPTAASCTDYDSGVFVADGAWRFVAVTLDRVGGTGVFYVDGAPVSVFDISCHAGSISNSSVLRIGASTLAVTDVFDGCIDEVELFRGPPTAAQIAEIYAAGAAGKCKPQCGCPGDLDGDCDIDLTDLSVLLSNFGTPSGATPGDGDLDGDGDVDLTDLSLFLAVFGTMCL